MPDPKNNGIVVDDVHDDARAALAEITKAQEADPPAEVKEPETAPVEVKEEPKTDDRPRGPDGKFVKKEGEPEPEPAKEVVPDTAVSVSDKEGRPPADIKAPLAEISQPVAAPPPGWSIPAKAEWDKLSPAVRDAIAKREGEVSNGFKQYEGLKPYVERAQKSGQSLPQVLQRFVGMEDAIRQNPQRGFMAVAENLGMTQPQAGQFFAQLAGALGAAPAQTLQNGVQPEYAPPQNGFDPSAILPQFQQLLDQRLGPLEQTLNQTMSQTRAVQERSVETAIERFRSDPAHRYFENVEPTIVQLFEAGIVQRTGDLTADLAKAYEIACWQNPEIRPLLINEQTAKTEADRKQREIEAAQKAKAAGKSISGVHAGAGVITALPGEDDVQAAARAAFRQHSIQ